jgi:hypothetical protein
VRRTIEPTPTSRVSSRRSRKAARADREARAKLEAEQQAVLIVEPKSTMAEECARPAENAANVPLIRGELGVVDCAVRIVDKRARTGAPTLRIGTIKERLQHMSVTAEDLCALGFEPAGRERAAPLYHDDDFPAICEAIAAQALAAKAQFLRDLAVVAA